MWLVMEPREISVCLKPPGFDPDLVVRSNLADFYRVWLGQIDYAAAVRSGIVRVEGPSKLVREFPQWLMWSGMAHYVRAERARRQALRGKRTPTTRSRVTLASVT
jgi:putative sterol carrier protein